MKITSTETGDDKYEQITKIMGSLYQLFKLNNYKPGDAVAAMMTICVNRSRISGMLLSEFQEYVDLLWKNDIEQSS